MNCANCGQQLPDSGVCYNCQKNENDAKRYGRGSGILPAYIKYNQCSNTPSPNPPKAEKESLIRKRRIGWPGVPGEGVSSKSNLIAVRQRSPSESKPTPKRRRSPRSVPSRTRGKSQQPKKPLQGVSLAHQRRGVNDFIKAIYQQPVLISDILKKRGFSDHQINIIKKQVGSYLITLVATWCDRWCGILTSRQIEIIANFYCFTGQKNRNNREIAQKLRVPVKFVVEELNEGMLKLRRPYYKQQIERAIFETATRVFPNSSSPL